MCLDYVYAHRCEGWTGYTVIKPSQWEGEELTKILAGSGPRIGYKVFRKMKAGVYVGHVKSGYTYKFKKSYESKTNFMLETACQTGVIYQSGYHILWSRQDARRYKRLHSALDRNLVICKVKYWNTTCVGQQDGNRVVISPNMQILEEVT